MAASRIFVKGLPPTFDEASFRKHFSQNGRQVTDAKIFPNRRIGYVGYKTAEDAQKAVKYFNKTFIRMSRIGVELARPIDVEPQAKSRTAAPTAVREPSNKVGSAELKRKRVSESKEKEADPKLKEFLNAYKPKSKKKEWEAEPEQDGSNLHLVDGQGNESQTMAVAEVDAGASDGEYENVPKKMKRAKLEAEPPIVIAPSDFKSDTPNASDNWEGFDEEADAEEPKEPGTQAPVSDMDWIRWKTSRTLGLLDDEEEQDKVARAESKDDAMDSAADPEPIAEDEPASAIATPSAEEDSSGPPLDKDIASVRNTMRLFVRNLPYDVQRDDLEAEFVPFGNLEEVHIPLDIKSGSAKGFAYIQYSDPDSAERALVDRDGQTFQGRLIHIIPAFAKKEKKLDDFELSKLPLKKQQQIKRKREAANTMFNWNALYMNQDAVVSSVANSLGISKSEVLDPTSSDAAVKQAHAETKVIQDTKDYFRSQGVDLDTFKRSQRGDTAILAKNIPYDFSRDELKRLFEEQGDVKRFLVPPSGTIAIVEYANAAQCQTAFGALAYRRVKSSVLFLEKAPKNLFSGKPIAPAAPEFGVEAKASSSDLKVAELNVPETAGTTTLFVRNLNFTTTTKLFTDTFSALDGFLSARVKTKTDPKKPGQVLSMGFGFLEFRSAKQAQAALQVMDGFTLEGHKLQIRASHRGADTAEERRKADVEKKAATAKTKLVIKNLPFEASKKDVRALLGAYGQLRSVRVPKKMDRAARGFGFAEFTTIREAQSAMEALRDTHLLGRRLVIDFAAEDPEDAEAEIEKMQQKVGAQANKVALQNLTSGGRKKFTTQNDEDAG
ncbi:hypothetical protein AC579_6665 [Pseudocercospora musae]|uniref:Multiple RNA-binding domain-containing protein 1 n=1 Tax=Pseudocercospora musae TaxID=113226 RepID=A0A139IPT7_9PEZI|nr:hypothetical protein AC579_6665 [Pseudocercospora musae]